MIQRYINTLSTKSHILPPQLHLDANVVNIDYEKAELFNQYFFSVFTKRAFQMSNLDEPNPPTNSLDAIHLTESDVFNAIANLNPHKAAEIDHNAHSVLKYCACTLTLPLHHLFKH